MMVPYATMQLLADVTRNPAWPDPQAPFVILGRDDDTEDKHYIQAYQGTAGTYVSQYRAGSEDRHFGVETFDRRLVFEAMWAWVVDDQERLQTIALWQHVEFDSEVE